VGALGSRAVLRRRILAVVAGQLEVPQMHGRVAAVQLEFAIGDPGVVLERPQMRFVVRIVERQAAELRKIGPDAAGGQVLNPPVVFMQPGAFTELADEQVAHGAQSLVHGAHGISRRVGRCRSRQVESAGKEVATDAGELMKIVVCVKQVPDTWSEKRLDPTDQTLDRAAAEAVIDELDTYAVEEALRIKESNDGSSVVVVTMGPAAATDTLRKALSMGADEAVHILDDALHGSDALATSLVLAKAIDRIGFDLVVLGSESTDARMGVIPAMLAERLGVPQPSLATKVEIDGQTVRVHRQTDVGEAVVSADLPAVVSVLEKINEPRYPSFKGIMAAKTKPTTTFSLADLGVDPASVGLAGAATVVIDAADRPARGEHVIVKDAGDAGPRIADFLVSRRLL
jgi:electron transfer flavoprotein beta subunit